MVARIKELKISDDSYSFILDNKKIDILKNLSKINIFVGKNNSGKSRFLRSIVADRNLTFIPDNKYFEDIKTIIPNLKNKINKFLDNRGLKAKDISIGISNLEEKLSEIEDLSFIKLNTNYIEQILDLKKYIEQLKEGIGSVKREIPELEIKPLGEKELNASSVGIELIRIFNNCLSGLEEDLKNINLFYNFNRIYIPILRGLRPLNYTTDDAGNEILDIKKDNYFIRTVNDYTNLQGEVFTGLTVYHDIKRFLLGNHKQRKLIREFEHYLSKNFFDNETITLIPSLDEKGNDDILTVKIGNEIEKPIYDLGDGIQSIIIFTLPLFLRKNEELLIFIEEPEHLLHPGLQRKLIETFSHEKGFENFQFFITTHSNHLLDITLDFDNISIFTVKKELEDSTNEEKNPSFTIENLSEGDTSALKLLGVRNSSVFLSNCTIWVEGITDRYYLRHYLELYQKEHKNDPSFTRYKEDYHYSFVEYGGNNITHWSFLDKEEKPINVEKLCGRLFLLADKDQGKEERHKQLKETLGTERVHILECREIENLISPEVLLEIVKDYEKIKDEDPLDNIKTDVEYSEYKTEYLGEFIESNIIKDMDKKVRKRSYKTDSGAINDKNGFFKKAKKYTQNWDDLTEEAQKLTERIYKFIEENNS